MRIRDLALAGSIAVFRRSRLLPAGQERATAVARPAPGNVRLEKEGTFMRQRVVNVKW